MQHREVMLPQQYVSRLIGKGGETIMSITHQSGADVKIRQETKDLGYSVAVITGRTEVVDAAERLIFEKLSIVGERFMGGSVPPGAGGAGGTGGAGGAPKPAGGQGQVPF